MILILSIIIPIFNEEENIPTLIDALETFKKDFNNNLEVICVDDGSRDQTNALLKNASEKRPWFKVITFSRNFGQTAALDAGFTEASGKIIVPIDADLQNNPNDIFPLLKKLEEGFDVVSGWRKNRQDAYITRLLPSHIANWLISRITKVPLHDYGCTLKAYRREVLEDIRLYGEMHRFIPAYAAWNGAHVTEIVVRHYPRTKGKSKYGIIRTFKVILDLIFVRFWTKYLGKPMHFFGGIGFIIFASGLTAGIIALYLKLIKNVSFIQTPLPLLTIFLIAASIQFILMGLLAEILTRTYHESIHKPPYHIRERLNF